MASLVWNHENALYSSGRLERKSASASFVNSWFHPLGLNETTSPGFSVSASRVATVLGRTLPLVLVKTGCFWGYLLAGGEYGEGGKLQRGRKLKWRNPKGEPSLETRSLKLESILTGSKVSSAVCSPASLAGLGRRKMREIGKREGEKKNPNSSVWRAQG